MGFLDEVQAHIPKADTTCLVGVMLGRLDPNLRAEVEQVLALPPSEAPHTAIQRALAARIDGTTPSATTISRHRRGMCCCE